MALRFEQLAALRPPFLGDSFPALKRAITLGRYTPIPQKYTDPLHSVIAQMLRLSPRERPSAEMLLKCPEVVAKLHLDELSSNAAFENESRAIMDLINTIKVPQNMNKLNSALPKPCYPDVRPNSPTSWTVAEQRHVQRKPPPLPPVPNIPSLNMGSFSAAGDGRENVAPIPSYREEYGVPTAVASARAPSLPVPTAALDDYYNRRPLAPVAASNKANIAPHRSGASDQQPVKSQQGHQFNRPQYQPSLDPIPAAVAAVMPPSLLQQPTAPSAPTGQRMAGNPNRLQYHHRMW